MHSNAFVHRVILVQLANMLLMSVYHILVKMVELAMHKSMVIYAHVHMDLRVYSVKPISMNVLHLMVVVTRKQHVQTRRDLIFVVHVRLDTVEMDLSVVHLSIIVCLCRVKMVPHASRTSIHLLAAVYPDSMEHYVKMISMNVQR